MLTNRVSPLSDSPPRLRIAGSGVRFGSTFRNPRGVRGGRLMVRALFETEGVSIETEGVVEVGAPKGMSFGRD